VTSFPSEFLVYVGRMREFSRADRVIYAAWVGLMSGLVLATLGFLTFGALHGVRYPLEAWLVPVGAFVFSLAIAIDTIGHLTVYKEVLKKAERLVHHITIFSGIAACVMLCAAWQQRGLFAIPSFVLTALSFLYSLIDEAFHWKRYESQHADRVEMWSHVFILIGHGTMMVAWWSWFWFGYRGVAETVAFMSAG
jgi:hypothetical protein